MRSPDFLGILEGIQKFMTELQCEPEHSWREQGNTGKCEKNSIAVANYARKFPRRRWSLGQNC